MKALIALIGASQVKPGDAVEVFLMSTDPAKGKVKCCAQKRTKTGWLVSHCGSTLMPIQWSWPLLGWIFHTDKLSEQKAGAQ